MVNPPEAMSKLLWKLNIQPRRKNIRTLCLTRYFILKYQNFSAGNNIIKC